MTDADDVRAPLAGVRVLDLADELAVAGTRLLAALGAAVVRPELPGGDEVRRRPPFATGDPATRLVGGDGADSLAHLVYGAGKHSVVVDWRTPAGRAALRELILGSDITICSRGRRFIDDLGFDVGTFAREHPTTALVVVDPFPAASPFRDAPYTDLTLSASGGFAWLCGVPDGPPEHPKGLMASTYAAIGASLAGLVGLTSRHLSGRAGTYELTGQEAVAFSTAQHGEANPYHWYGQIPSRVTWGATLRRSLLPCQDGKLVSFVMMGPRLPALITWLADAGVSEKFAAPEWQDQEYYTEHLGELTAAIGTLCSLYPGDELVEQAEERLLMVLPVSTVPDLLVDPQLAAREVFRPVEGMAKLRLPRAPMVFSRGRLPEPTRAPALGAADAAVLADWNRPRPARVPDGNVRLPLAGLRVADFTWMLAGPLASRFLADLGADVIRIESHVRRDLTREIGTQPPGFQGLDTNSHQHQAGCNKRSLALDLRQPGAIAVARQVIASADIVLDNYRPGTMAKWGLSPQELLAEWPRLIVATMPAVGTTGPRNQYGAVGNGIAAYAGVNSMTGFPENPPFGVGPIIGDFFAPLFTAQAILSAYHHLQVSGEGQHVDCPMFESCLWLLDTAFADLQLNGWAPERIGNRHECFSPHGLFPCTGEDEWIAIAVTTDEHWTTLAGVLALDEAATARFARYEARAADEAALEELVAGRTSARDKWELALELQRAGVAAAPVEHVVDHLTRDAGLAQRFSLVEHPYGPTFYVQNQFIRPEGRTVENRRSPMIGEHSDEVLRELGLAEDAIADLWVKGIIN